MFSVQGYGNQEEDDMDGWGAGGPADASSKDKLAAKHKSRTISINPTEGFQYSDVYFVSQPISIPTVRIYVVFLVYLECNRLFS